MSTPDPTPAAPALPDAPEPVVTPDPPAPVEEPIAETPAEPVVVDKSAPVVTPGSTTQGGVLPVPATIQPGPILEARRRAVDEEGGVHQPRTDDDAIVNSFVTIVEGPYAGRYAVYQSTLTSGNDGYPETVLVRTRDDRDESLVVDYAHLRPAAPGGR